MNLEKRRLLISIALLLLAIIFTALVKIVDVKEIGETSTSIGFATLNQFILNKIGVNMTWYHITEFFGILAILIALIYAIIGIIELIKRKSILKVDKEIILLGIFYIVIIGLYFLFEKFVVNYRPILMENVLEASYPSSHTLITICICGSSVIINKKLFNNLFTKIINCILILVILITIIGRLISGVHWFTDIIGGAIISLALIATFNFVINLPKKENVDKK